MTYCLFVGVAFEYDCCDVVFCQRNKELVLDDATDGRLCDTFQVMHQINYNLSAIFIQRINVSTQHYHNIIQ